MFIDGRGKLFGKVNIIDIIIIVLVLGAIGGLGYKLAESKVSSPLIPSRTDTIETVIYVDEVKDFIANSIKIGDTVKDGILFNEFGVVKSVKIGDSDSYAANDKGEFVKSSKPGYVSLYLTIEGKGVFRDNGVTFGNNEYYIGSSPSQLRIGNTAINIYSTKIYDIKKR